ncbi:MAG: LCP family protein [Oscillospiraceae bacterium]
MSKRYKGKTRSQKLVTVLLVLLFLGAAAFAGVKLLFREPELPPADPVDGEQTGDEAQDPAQLGAGRKESFYNILVCGVDDGNGGSDTMILVSVDAKKPAINCISIPRDTLIDVDWTVKKINASYNRGGVELVAEKVSELMGVPVDFTVEVNLQGFIELVDAIGGVDFEVPLNMNYDDPYQDLHIHVSKGMQHLDGKTAMGVVRFRHNNDGSGYGTQDIGRIGTQQAFLKAVAKQMLATISPDDFGTYAKLFKQYVETDLTVNNLLWLGQQALAAGMDNIHFYTLPGDGTGYYKGGSYYILYDDQVLSLVNDYFNPYTEPRTLEDLHVFVPEGYTRPENG